MPHGARTFTAEEILQFLDENYDIPGDGEHSELDSDDENLLVEEVAISDDEGSENEENPDDIHSFDVIEESSSDSEVDETADPAVRRGRLPQFDFSSVSWVEDSDMPTQGKFHQEISTVYSFAQGCHSKNFLSVVFHEGYFDEHFARNNEVCSPATTSTGERHKRLATCH